MTKERPLDELWNAAPPAEDMGRAAQGPGRPAAARRYLEHAIAAGIPLASAVRLRMHGEIKLRRWRPFGAEQVIRWGRGMIWSATVRLHGLPILGSDRLIDGTGALRWKLFGVIPVMTAAGPDITRSAAGRVATESVWLPSALCGHGVSWTAPDPSHARASFAVQGEPVQLELTVDGRGRLETVRLQRWGNPGGAAFHYADFGAAVEQEGTFGGYTIPTRLRVGWYVESDRFEPDGEFFRVTVDDATYR
jgi:hypothetical protein